MRPTPPAAAARRPAPGPAAPLLAAPLLAAALFLLGGCQTTDGTAEATRPLVPADAAPGTYWRGDHSQAFERAYVVARSPQDWAELWARVGDPAPAPLPDDRMAVAVFLGPRDTAGYAVTIERAELRDGALLVGYRERVPGPAQAVAQMQTSPYAIRLLPRTPGAPIFQREK